MKGSPMSASDSEFDKLSGHNYDGIQEYDNPMPGWWIALFIATIVWAIGYWSYYESGVPDRSVADDYSVAQAADLKKRFAGMGELKPTEANMLSWSQNNDYMLVGQSVFKANCVSCHGAEGQGVVGVNLTDNFGKNIKKMTDIPRVVTGGAANGAMPAWGNRLHPNEIALVATYVSTLRGKNIPGRPKEGDLLPEWPKAEAATTSGPAK